MSQWIDKEFMNKFLQFFQSYFFQMVWRAIYIPLSGIFILKFYYTECSVTDNKRDRRTKGDSTWKKQIENRMG